MAWINLDRPEVRNALNAELIHELTEVFEWLNSRDDIRVVILKGNGKAFCAGADLEYMKAMAGFSYNQNIADAEKLSKLFQTIYFCNKAVIVDVHGACIGGISPFVVSKIGNTAAKELMLTGRRFTADEAKAFGLVNVVVDEAEMVDTERQYIEHFMHASPDAIAECKNLLRMVTGTNDPFSPVFHDTSVLIANQRISEAGQEGMKAFFEKRKPNWE